MDERTCKMLKTIKFHTGSSPHLVLRSYNLFDTIQGGSHFWDENINLLFCLV